MTEDKFMSELSKLLKRMPPNTELIVLYGEIGIYKKGSLVKHIGSKNDGYGLSASGIEPIDYILTKNVIPYSEGT